MKKIFFALCIVLFSLALAQKSDSLVFNKNFTEVENQWVAIENGKEKNQYWFAFLYFDESGGGYSLQYVGDFGLENGKYIKKSEDSDAMNIVRLPHGDIPFAVLPQKAIQEMNLKIPDFFLKNYNYLKDENQKNLTRANGMNALGKPDLALPVLQKLNHQLFSTPEFKELFFFETAFAYNALGQFDNAEKILDEAQANGIFNELLLKESIFSLVNNKKIDKASKILEENLHIFKSPLFREETIANLIMGMHHIKDKKGLEKWFKIYDKDYSEKGKYKERMKELKAQWKL